MQVVIGLEGSGADIELEMVRQTAKAYCLRTWFDAEFWLPKAAFEEDGTLSAWGRRLYQEKLDDAAAR